MHKAQTFDQFCRAECAQDGFPFARLRGERLQLASARWHAAKRKARRQARLQAFANVAGVVMLLLVIAVNHGGAL